MTQHKLHCKTLVLKEITGYAGDMIIPGTKLHSDDITTIISDIAAREIMPLFQQLGDDDIQEKKQGELVTVADLATEAALSKSFQDVLPGSAILGEEGVSEDPSQLNLIHSQTPVWIIDPIDGTGNYARGIRCFAVMVAFLNHGKIQAGWIHDPITQKTCSAVVGQGAWCDGVRLTTRQKEQEGQKFHSMSTLKGSVGHRLSKRLQRRIDNKEKDLPSITKRYRCCGREYMDLALGKIQYLQYGLHLKPWDHAPGVLIASEAGYHQGFLEDATPYNAAGSAPDGHLMIAPDSVAWQTLRNLLWD